MTQHPPTAKAHPRTAAQPSPCGDREATSPCDDYDSASLYRNSDRPSCSSPGTRREAGNGERGSTPCLDIVLPYQVESEPMHNPNPDSNYDVFLSSRSGDTDEEPFASHLYTSLQKAGISVFWDDDDSLSGDKQISPSLLQVIQRCRISVVVLSEGYAGSRRCLEVLEQIIECRRMAVQFVLPVFLGISREDVLYQSSGFGNAFDDLTKRISDKDKVGSWKLAFARICQIQPYRRVELQKDLSRSIDGW